MEAFSFAWQILKPWLKPWLVTTGRSLNFNPAAQYFRLDIPLGRWPFFVGFQKRRKEEQQEQQQPVCHINLISKQLLTCDSEREATAFGEGGFRC